MKKTSGGVSLVLPRKQPRTKDDDDGEDEGA
jgi:hypothetical protein